MAEAGREEEDQEEPEPLELDEEIGEKKRAISNGDTVTRKVIMSSLELSDQSAHSPYTAADVSASELPLASSHEGCNPLEVHHPQNLLKSAQVAVLKGMHTGSHKLCIHNRQKSECRECGGSQICPHNRRKRQCKDCVGSQICQHMRRKSRCKDCNGSQICQHQRIRSTCKECRGSQICPHNRIKSQCRECGGSQICPHDRRRRQCKECGGSQICQHNKRRSRCVECGGSETKCVKDRMARRARKVLDEVGMVDIADGVDVRLDDAKLSCVSDDCARDLDDDRFKDEKDDLLKGDKQKDISGLLVHKSDMHASHSNDESLDRDSVSHMSHVDL
eukprot:764280-Hanusia_phi.AAC.9